MVWDKVKGAAGWVDDHFGINPLNPGDPGGFFKSRADGNPYGEIDANGAMTKQVGAANRFANQGERGFAQYGQQAQGALDHLGGIMRGENSLSAEQLRQGLQQNLAGQRSMAASARPGNSAMAARTAAIQGGRMGSGLAGQQAMAGIAERNAAAGQFGGLAQGLRGQDLQAALGSRGQAIGGLGTLENAKAQRFNAMMQEPTRGEKMQGFLGGIAGAFGMSDVRTKKDIAEADDEATDLLRGLKAYTWNYKDEKHGKGKHLGIMAQDLEATGLGKAAIIETPEGKAIHGAKLAGALAAAAASMNRRLEKLEK